MTTSILVQLCTFLKNTTKWHFAKLIITNSEATTPLSNLTSGFHLLTTGQSCGRTFLITPKHASNAKNVKNLQINCHDFTHFQIQSDPTYAFTQTCSGQCSPWAANTNTSFASRTPLQSTCSSRRSKTRKLKWSPRPFSTNDFVNLASRRKFTLTAGRSLVTSFQTSYLRYLTFSTLKQLRPIPSLMPRLMFSTKPSRST
jgi:hypothetical protein